MKQVYTIEEVARELEMSRRQAYRWAMKAGITSARVGTRRRLLVGRPDLERIRKERDRT